MKRRSEYSKEAEIDLLINDGEACRESDRSPCIDFELDIFCRFSRIIFGDVVFSSDFSRRHLLLKH